VLCYQLIRNGVALPVESSFVEYSWIIARLAEQHAATIGVLMNMFEIPVLKDDSPIDAEKKYVVNELHKGDIFKHWR